MSFVTGPCRLSALLALCTESFRVQDRYIQLEYSALRAACMYVPQIATQIHTASEPLPQYAFLNHFLTPDKVTLTDLQFSKVRINLVYYRQQAHLDLASGKQISRGRTRKIRYSTLQPEHEKYQRHSSQLQVDLDASSKFHAIASTEISVAIFALYLIFPAGLLETHFLVNNAAADGSMGSIPSSLSWKEAVICFKKAVFPNLAVRLQAGRVMWE
ncbi:hypothetical protein B0H14DRAFT_2614598 [Mycena olivaceomarginata]|nr:hypothetical protein B0H14DRAFT_2614598 [Mycena olivaceomarginata]